MGTGSWSPSAPEREFVTDTATPHLSSELIPRPKLIERLLRSPPARLVLLTAPAGYSKTTCLAEWAAIDTRPFAWIAADGRYDDPALLVSSIVEALGEIEPLDPDLLAPLSSPRPNFSTVVLPRLSRSLRRRSEPFVLVVDDVHGLHSPEAFEVLEAVIQSLPDGSQVALGSRTEPQLPLGRMRAKRNLVELTYAELKMSRAESGELLAKVGLDLIPDQLDVLFECTEGWPAALYLAGLALAGKADMGAAVASFAGDDRIVVDYLRDEFLGTTSPAKLSFLTRSSLLDELSGPLCDAVLERSGSARLLRDLARSNSLVVSLDRKDSRYRYHHLFREMLQSELRRRKPELEVGIHARASRWYAAHADPDRAIEHAIAAGDLDRTAELIWLAFPDLIGRGRIATIGRWLDHLGDDRVASSGTLALAAAHRCLALGDGVRAAHWRRLAGASADASEDGDRSIEADIRLLDATIAIRGVVQMGEDAARASELFPPETPWQMPCYFYRGVSAHLTGHPERAVPLLREAARRGAVVAPVMQVLALSQLCLIATDEGDWDTGLRLAAQAREQVSRCGLVDYPVVAMVYATSAMVDAHEGQIERAQADVADANRLRLEIADFLPWYEVQVRLLLARACARLDDLESARVLLAEAALFLEGVPDAIILSGCLEQSSASLKSALAKGRGVGWALTRAELRTLQYLPSHLAFREIGERIHLSPNTVKTQAQAIYRKLGASSRAEAVERARDAGLLGR